MNAAYQKAKHERTSLEKETSKLGIQMLGLLAAIWEASTRRHLPSQEHFSEGSRATARGAAVGPGGRSTGLGDGNCSALCLLFETLPVLLHRGT